ncbi:MAG: hypothetical protein ABIE70_08230, partial [bacterium]
SIGGGRRICPGPQGMLKKFTISGVKNCKVLVQSGDSPEGHPVTEQALRESRDATGRSWLIQHAPQASSELRLEK